MARIGVCKSYIVVVMFIHALVLPAAGLNMDSAKYIGIDDVRTDMEAYCLSVFSGTEVERFNLKILSVVRGVKTGQDMILVVGDDERFNHSSAIHGCSGSPVFIEGRLAGALAAGWDGSLDSLYLVRPIKDMLEVGSAESLAGSEGKMALGLDFSVPLDLETCYRQSIEYLQGRDSGSRMYLPLSSSLPGRVLEAHDPVFKGLGFMTVASDQGMINQSFEEAGTYEQGSVLALVLCGGDISLAATGTVTEVIGDEVYGFGHSYKGNGAVNLPMATGVIHTVVASRRSSFKLASPGPITGTLLFDQSTAVRGTIGVMPKTIPLHIEVKRYNDPEDRVYDCHLAVDPAFTPTVLQAVLNGAATMQGVLPLEHTIRYQAKIALSDGDSFTIDNVSSAQQTYEISRDFYSTVGLLLNNPFEEVDISSIEVKMDIEPVNLAASIWAAKVDRTEVRAGQTVSASVILRSYRSQDQTVTVDLKIPETLGPGRYKLQFMGAGDYQSYVSSMAPQRLRAVDMASLKSALGRLLEHRRDRLYAVMPIPASGVVMRQHELGQLPPTKMLLMQDSKRIQPLEPYRAWAENGITTDQIVKGVVEAEIVVKQ